MTDQTDRAPHDAEMIDVRPEGHVPDTVANAAATPTAHSTCAVARRISAVMSMVQVTASANASTPKRRRGDTNET